MPGAVFLEGDKVELKTIEGKDLDFLEEIYNHPEVLPNLTWDRPRNRKQFKENFEEKISSKERIDLLIEAEGDRIGQILLLEKDEGVAEIGIWLHPEKQGKGYGTEASKLIIEYAFEELRYHKVLARAYQNNQKSQKVWEKLGFQKEGTLREQIYTKGEFKDAYLYGLLKKEYDH